ncbi:MAG: RecX family transcriptional regulator [Candidatus Cloacimonadaceae bacterium]
MKLKYWAKTEKARTALVSLNDELWGVLELRTLRSLYPLSQEVELDEAGQREIVSLLEKRVWWLLCEYLAQAEHSEYQCREYLKRKEFHPSLIQKAITLALEKKLIDDRRFSEILIQSLIDRGKSKRYIIEKLYAHKIPANLYETLLEMIVQPEQVKDNINAQMQKLLDRYRELPPAKRKEKVFASLYRKGFDLEDIISRWQVAGDR